MIPIPGAHQGLLLGTPIMSRSTRQFALITRGIGRRRETPVCPATGEVKKTFSYPPDRSRGLIPTLPLPRLVNREAEPVVSGVEQPAAEARNRKFVDSLLEGAGFEPSVPPQKDVG